MKTISGFSAHDMYLPDKRARRVTPPLYQPPQVKPAWRGTHEERQAWMRQKQEAKATEAKAKPQVFHITAVVNKPPEPKPEVYRHPNSIIVRLAEQLRAKGVL